MSKKMTHGDAVPAKDDDNKYLRVNPAGRPQFKRPSSNDNNNNIELINFLEPPAYLNPSPSPLPAKTSASAPNRAENKNIVRRPGLPGVTIKEPDNNNNNNANANNMKRIDYDPKSKGKKPLFIYDDEISTDSESEEDADDGSAPKYCKRNRPLYEIHSTTNGALIGMPIQVITGRQQQQTTPPPPPASVLVPAAAADEDDKEKKCAVHPDLAALDDEELCFRNMVLSTKKPTEDDWTDEEHELFLLGTLKYGRNGNWKKVAKKYVKTRDARQVRLHAFHVFKFLMQQRPPPNFSVPPSSSPAALPPSPPPPVVVVDVDAAKTVKTPPPPPEATDKITIIPGGRVAHTTEPPPAKTLLPLPLAPATTRIIVTTTPVAAASPVAWPPPQYTTKKAKGRPLPAPKIVPAPPAPTNFTSTGPAATLMVQVPPTKGKPVLVPGPTDVTAPSPAAKLESLASIKIVPAAFPPPKTTVQSPVLAPKNINTSTAAAATESFVLPLMVPAAAAAATTNYNVTTTSPSRTPTGGLAKVADQPSCYYVVENAESAVPIQTGPSPILPPPSSISGNIVEPSFPDSPAAGPAGGEHYYYHHFYPFSGGGTASSIATDNELLQLQQQPPAPGGDEGEEEEELDLNLSLGGKYS